MSQKKSMEMERKNDTKEIFVQPAVTLIIPTHSAPVDAVVAAVKKQAYKGEVTIIVMDDGHYNRIAEMPKGITYIHNEKNLGLARNMNKGISLARTPYVITLHQDCIPNGEHWLSLLMRPLLENSAVVLSSSQQIIPKAVWEQFSFWHKVFAVPELSLQKTINEHATAYRLDVLSSCGLFDALTYKTAGEDTDLFMKMRKHGLLAVSDALVAHVHAPHNDSLWRFITKVFVRDNEAMGVLHRKYTFQMGFQFWYDLLRTFLFLFFIIFLFYNPWISLAIFCAIVFLANVTHLSVIKHVLDLRLVFLPFVYTFVWFVTLLALWKGFITEKQSWFNN